MCGIVAMIAPKSIKDDLIDALEKLEYRGYDSAGIATIEANEIKITKQIGKISNLKKTITNTSHNGKIGIAHTRWATHGLVNQTNSHPFKKGNWCIVHNGIINNYLELKSENNISTVSQTDTEVILHLLAKQNTDDISAVINVCKKLKGSYALAILNQQTNKIYFAKYKNPLFIAKPTNNTIIGASDVVCIASTTDEFYRLEDKEFCEATENSVKFFNFDNKEIFKHTQKINNINYETSKDNYSHFMQKEILQTPQILTRIYQQYKTNENLKSLPTSLLHNINRVKFVGCGTAYHSTLFGARYLQDISGIECSAHIASEFNYELLTKNTLCIFVSQSGETADTLNAISIAKKSNCTTIAITNVMHSTIANMVDYCLPIFAGVEIAVASTKAYVAQVAVMQFLAHHFANKTTKTKFLSDFKKFSQTFQLPLDKDVNKIVQHLSSHDYAFILGRGNDFYTAQEAALKIKEITYINCVAMQSGELKHGTLALIDEGTPVIMICTDEAELDKSLSAKQEVEARGGNVLFVSCFSQYADILLPKYKPNFMPTVSIIPFQLSSYLISVQKGINPDQPRNLAKSVTVE